MLYKVQIYEKKIEKCTLITIDHHGFSARYSHIMIILCKYDKILINIHQFIGFSGYDEKSYDIFRYVRSANVGTEKYTKITKHPLYVFLKGLFKIITKIFSSDSVQ